MGEAVTDESKLALLDILLDRVKELVLGDLKWTESQRRVWRVNSDVGLENTSSLALVHLGISTIMLRMVCSWLA
jgi:hypothetical protein